MQDKKIPVQPPPFRSYAPPGKPYYFIHTSLNISEILPLGGNVPFEFMMYFNRENNFNYLAFPEIDKYPHYWTFLENSGVIEDILIYSSPSINQTNTLDNIYLTSIRAGLTAPPSTNSYVFEDQWTGVTGINTTNIINILSDTQLDYISQKRSLGRRPRLVDKQNKYLGLYIQGTTGPDTLSKRSTIFIHLVIKVYTRNT